MNASEIKGSSTGSILIGLDCGGTASRCQIATETGDVIGRGAGGPGNYQVVGTEVAADSVYNAIRTAFEQAQSEIDFSEPRLLSLCAGVAGAGRNEDIPVVTGFVRAAAMKAFVDTALDLGRAKIKITTDAAIALVGGTLGQPGVLVIAGTGSIAYGINHQGQHARAGGWGPLISDQGSGYDIGCQALRAIVRAEDGLGPDTSLKAAIMEQLGMTQLSELIRIVNREASRSQIAALARCVLEEACKEDAVAKQLVQDAATHLQELAVAVIRKLKLEAETTPVIAAGGLLTEQNSLYRLFAETLVEHKVIVQMPVLPPVAGALLLAYQEINPRGSLTAFIDSIKEMN